MKIVPIKDMPKKEDIKEVSSEDLLEIYKTCKLMEKVCTENNGIGLNAAQVGIPLKLFIVRSAGFKHGETPIYDYYVNCRYSPIGETVIPSVESCLSILNEDGSFKTFKVSRYETIKVDGFKLVESDSGLELKKYSAIMNSNNNGIVMQHEIDHSSDILISNIGEEFFFWKG